MLKISMFKFKIEGWKHVQHSKLKQGRFFAHKNKYLTRNMQRLNTETQISFDYACSAFYPILKT